MVRHSNHNGSDKRITLVSVTSSGMSLVDGLLIAAQQHEEVVLAPLGLRKSKILKQVLQELIERHSIENTNTADKSTSDKNNEKNLKRKKSSSLNLSKETTK